MYNGIEGRSINNPVRRVEFFFASTDQKQMLDYY